MTNVKTPSLRILALTLFAACAGSGDATSASGSDTAGETTSSASASSTSVGGTAASSTSSSTDGTATSTGEGTGLSTSEATSDATSDATLDPTGCFFICDVPPGCVQVPNLPGEVRCTGCDLWLQDCPEGEKCTAWANDGGNSWNDVKCVPAGEDKPGEPCTAVGSGLSGLDSCELGAMCWDVDPVTLTGTCVGLCDGSRESPTCAEPNTACSLANDGVLILCLPTCDPLAQDCPEDKTCANVNGDFHCVPLAEEPGGYGQPCESIATCAPGLACLNAVEVPGCEGTACCSPYCKVSDPNLCPGVPEQSCVPYYEPGEAPEGYEELGVCAIP
ncbi:MAG: hypothetical protein R3B09_12660 [Nannocystaceae bacterium]